MRWVDSFDIFLFDLDGLLVDTEIFHFMAYSKLLLKRGYRLDWDFPTYCRNAHSFEDSLKDSIYREFPDLLKSGPDWQLLKDEKRGIYLEILKKADIKLMEGVEELLKMLQGKKMAVVTNSKKDEADLVCRKVPRLKAIPLWITRERYDRPKPSPDGYLKAVSILGGDRVIGFEDAPKGAEALLASKATAVMIGGHQKRDCMLVKRGVLFFRSFFEFFERFST